jgi:hypothetical protein
MLSFLLEGFVEISEHRTTWLSVEIWRRCRTPNTGIYICGRLSEELGRGLRSTSRDQLGALDEVALTPLLKLSTRKRSLVLREHSQTFIHQGSGASFDSLPYVWSLRCFSPSRKEKHCMARNRLDVHTHLVPPFDMSRRNVLVRGAAMVAAFGLPVGSLAYQSSPASASAPHGNNQGVTHINMITTKDERKFISKTGVRVGPSCSHTVGRSVRMRGTHRCCF